MGWNKWDFRTEKKKKREAKRVTTKREVKVVVTFPSVEGIPIDERVVEGGHAFHISTNGVLIVRDCTDNNLEAYPEGQWSGVRVIK
ncbi:hypothetical protein PQC38_gp050 [Aeromonas phage BUCT695]|uniref:hypothetical protein n=1 Tax=Aeromonas phage BUCT695 TaxID=2908630 RepID=UPI0023292A6D|nr:hypothetical protein PQC38_gp050 [Aeromonas phage BUCT695]UIW10526.1 hypothetical protein [Aeromonas phage BUCT695]